MFRGKSALGGRELLARPAHHPAVDGTEDGQGPETPPNQPPPPAAPSLNTPRHSADNEAGTLKMSDRMRQREIAFPVTKLVALVAVGLVLVPKLPLIGGVCLGLAIVSILGLLLYHLHTRTEKRGATKETPLDSATAKGFARLQAQTTIRATPAARILPHPRDRHFGRTPAALRAGRVQTASATPQKV